MRYVTLYLLARWRILINVVFFRLIPILCKHLSKRKAMTVDASLATNDGYNYDTFSVPLAKQSIVTPASGYHHNESCQILRSFYSNEGVTLINVNRQKRAMRVAQLKN